jgi:hypothetical protein
VVRIATVCFKLKKGLTEKSDYEAETEAWIYFSHELEGLTEGEVTRFYSIY